VSSRFVALSHKLSRRLLKLSPRPLLLPSRLPAHARPPALWLWATNRRPASRLVALSHKLSPRLLLLPSRG